MTGPNTRNETKLSRTIQWAGLSALLILFLVAACSTALRDQEFLYRENGVLEILSVMFWCASVLLGYGTAFRGAAREHRFLAFLMATIALLAALREVDAHILLNPKHLGSLGVRYRIDWWLNPKVSLPLKLGWALVFLGLNAAVLYPLSSIWRSLWQSLLKRETVPMLVLMSFVLLGMGFAIDDLLRHSSPIALGTRQLMEETAEVLGAVLYLLAGIVHMREKGVNSR